MYNVHIQSIEPVSCWLLAYYIQCSLKKLKINLIHACNRHPYILHTHCAQQMANLWFQSLATIGYCYKCNGAICVIMCWRRRFFVPILNGIMHLLCFDLIIRFGMGVSCILVWRGTHQYERCLFVCECLELSVGILHEIWNIEMWTISKFPIELNLFEIVLCLISIFSVKFINSVSK